MGSVYICPIHIAKKTLKVRIIKCSENINKDIYNERSILTVKDTLSIAAWLHYFLIQQLGKLSDD